MSSGLVAKRPLCSGSVLRGRTVRGRTVRGRTVRGRIVGSLVLSVILFVLIPTWLLGNLFIAVFPPSNSSTTAATPDSFKRNSTSQAGQNPQVSSLPIPSIPQTGGEDSKNEVAATVVAEEPNHASQNAAVNSTSVVSDAAPARHQEPEFRLWTNSAGKTVEAKFVRYVGDKIELITSAGKPAVVSPSIFSAEDQEYLKQLLSKQ